MTPKQPANKGVSVIPDGDAYDEERVPFADVMRKLANTKPPHKAVKPAKKAVKTPSVKG